jgi:hypothetical protein
VDVDTSPFELAGSWYRGNLHGHTTESDGSLTPADYAGFYRSHGYDFAAVTDHWRLTDMGRYADRAFAWIPGAELDGRDERRGTLHHVLGLGLRDLPPREAAATLQGTVDAIRSRGGLAFVAHPYWSAQTSADLLAADGYAGIEVWNATAEVRWGKGLASVHWDEMLQSGRWVSALATDDAHHRPEQGDDMGLGWVMVRAAERTTEAILRALAAGSFYASTGPEILDLRLERGAAGSGQGPVARVRCSPCRRVHFICAGSLGRTVNAPPGTALEQAELRLHPAARYLRVECVDAAGRTAWSMPIAVRSAGG